MDAQLREKMGTAGYARFNQHFTFEQMLAKTKKVYYEVLEEAYGAGRF